MKVQCKHNFFFVGFAFFWKFISFLFSFSPVPNSILNKLENKIPNYVKLHFHYTKIDKKSIQK